MWRKGGGRPRTFYFFLLMKGVGWKGWLALAFYTVQNSGGALFLQYVLQQRKATFNRKVAIMMNELMIGPAAWRIFLRAAVCISGDADSSQRMPSPSLSIVLRVFVAACRFAMPLLTVRYAPGL